MTKGTTIVKVRKQGKRWKATLDCGHSILIDVKWKVGSVITNGCPECNLPVVVMGAK